VRAGDLVAAPADSRAYQSPRSLSSRFRSALWYRKGMAQDDYGAFSWF
jgi:hypothetical protein